MKREGNSKKPSIAKPWLKYYDDSDIAEEVPQCSMYDYLYQKNKDYMDQISLDYFDREISFCELFENIQKTARAYLALGVKAGDIVIVCAVTTPEIIYSFYALDLIGATPNMVDPRTSPEGIHEYIEESRAKYVCVLSVAYPKIQEAVGGTEVGKIVVVSPADSLAGIKRAAYQLTSRDKNVYSPLCISWNRFIEDGANTALAIAPYSPAHCGAIVHTGGTTGTPKGVMLSDDAFNAIASQYEKAVLKLIRKQKFLDIMPPFIAYGFACGVHMPLSNGLTVVVIPNLDPNKLGSLLRKYKPAHMCGVPAHYEVLVNDKHMRKADLSYLVNTGAGGDAITVGAEDDVNQFLKAHGCKFPLAKGYGMTECCSATCNCMGDKNKRGSVGIPLVKTVISTFEPGTDREMDIGEKGEICITGPTNMLGYQGKPEETANVLRTHSDGKVWVHTGDIGYVDEDGFVFIDNRIKRMIIRYDGFKVFPSMIENTVSMHPAVQSCSVVAKRDKTKPQGNLPYVFVVLKKDAQKSQKEVEAEIIQLCRDKLPEYAQPIGYRFCDSLFYTPIGKVDYQKLELELV